MKTKSLQKDCPFSLDTPCTPSCALWVKHNNTEGIIFEGCVFDQILLRLFDLCHILYLIAQKPKD